ncbi:hypothetical protein, partial [Clostridium tarantellae]
MKILFQIENFNIEDSTLFVKSRIEDINEKESIQLYLGKVKFNNLKCENFIEQKSSFALIYTNNCNSVSFSYFVKIGHLAKHGHGGEISEELITFSGEQVLIFPVETLTMNNKNNSIISNIKIFFQFKNYKHSILPLKYKKQDMLSIDFPKWINIYDIMKSSYTFGDFSIHKSIYNENILEIFCEKNFIKKEIDENVIDDLKRLHKYYCKLFNSNGMKLNVVLLNESVYDEKYVLGGCGVSSIAATFNYKNIRDWQLLAHRMFHSFMDFNLKSREVHIPPNLWLTEGLATYYEIIALNNLSNLRKKELNINIENDFKKLFTRYLYIKLKNSNISSIIPMNERNIKSHGNMEFLHYTLAPLIVKLIESEYSKLNNNYIIKEIILLNEKNKELSMENIFYNILKENLNEFASKYLFSNE